MSKLIIITGFLATLKTTIASKLSEELNIMSLQKDSLKEVLVDHIGFQTREDNLKLSKATFFIMKHLVEKSLKHHEHIIIESNFKPHELCVLKKSPMIENIDILTIFLYGDPIILYDRYCQRQPLRHSAHTSTGLMSFEVFKTSMQTYVEEDGLGKIIAIDTTVFLDEHYQALLTHVKSFLGS